MSKKVILLTFFLFYVLIPTLIAQNNVLDTKLSINLEKTTIEKALNQLENQINFNFTYDQSILEGKKNINLSIKNATLKNCLDSIFNDTTIIYKQINNHIVIKRKIFSVQNEKKNDIDTSQKSIVIQGQIIDDASKEPIPYVAIAIHNQSIGVITNIDGRFVMKIPPTFKTNQLIVSHIGYENLILPIDTLYNRTIILKLKPSYVSIQEVIIRNTDAKFLLKSAIQNIEKNYSSQPIYLTTFYREGIKKQGNFMFFSEAVLKIYKTSYTNETEKDQIKVLKSRKMRNVSANDTVVLKIKSGLESILYLDIVKNRADFLQEENFDYYDYKMVDIVTYNNKACYSIDFEQKDFVIEPLYKGTIYIDNENLAIIGADFQVNPDRIDHAQNSFVIKKTRGIKIKILDTHYLLSYRKIGDFYYLNYTKGEMNLKLRKRNKLFPTNFSTTLEMGLSDIDTLDVERFTRKETEELNSIFSDIQHQYDEAYWEDYNFIKPDDSWQEAIRKLKQKHR